MSISAFEAAIERAEQHLDLGGQPRAIVFHEKDGRRHAHVVWSRIDSEEMKAINLPHFKLKLKDLSKDLFLDHGWDLPEGFKDPSLRDPMTFSREEWQQAKRAKQDPRQLKAMFRECWASSDSRNSFRRALEENGFYLAKGNRRGVVAVDYRGDVFAVSRWSGQKAKDIKAKLGDPSSLPSVEETKSKIAERMTGLIKRYIREADSALETKDAAIALKTAQIKERHCAARRKLIERQAERWADETIARANRFRRGLAGAWDWLSGKSRKIARQNEEEAYACVRRDDEEREEQRQRQLQERREVQSELVELKKTYSEEILALKADVALYLDLQSDPDHQHGDGDHRQPDHNRDHQERSPSDHGRQRDRDDGYRHDRDDGHEL